MPIYDPKDEDIELCSSAASETTLGNLQPNGHITLAEAKGEGVPLDPNDPTISGTLFSNQKKITSIFRVVFAALLELGRDILVVSYVNHAGLLLR